MYIYIYIYIYIYYIYVAGASTALVVVLKLFTGSRGSADEAHWYLVQRGRSSVFVWNKYQ